MTEELIVTANCSIGGNSFLGHLSCQLLEQAEMYPLLFAGSVILLIGVIILLIWKKNKKRS